MQPRVPGSLSPRTESSEPRTRAPGLSCAVPHIATLVTATEVEGLLDRGVFRLAGNAHSDDERHARRVVQPETDVELAIVVGTANSLSSPQQETSASGRIEGDPPLRCITIRPAGNFNDYDGRIGLSLAGPDVLQGGGRRTEQVRREG